MSRYMRPALVAVFFCVLMAVTVPAFGQTAVWDSVDVIAHDDGPEAVLIITGALPDQATLPARVVLSAPAGAELQWAGEILGGDVSDDPSVTPTKTTKAGADVYEFTLAKARRGQIEVLVPAVSRVDGSAYAASLTWPSATAVPKVSVSVRLPAGAAVQRTADGAFPETAADGSAYYTRAFTDVQAGDDLALEFGYSAPVAGSAAAASQQPAAAGSATGTFIPVLIGLGALAAGIALIIGVSRKLQGKSSSAEDDLSRDPVDYGEPADAGVEYATDAGAAGSDDDEAQKGPTEGSGRSRRLSPVAIMIGGVVATAVLAVLVVGVNANPQVVDGKVTKSFGGEASACTSATIALVPNEGVDLARSSEKLFESFNGIAGIGAVTLHVDEPRVEVEFCESTTSEQAIRAAMSASGLVTF